jgi:hypothetical protein
MITHLRRPLPADSPAARGIEVLARAHQDLVWSRQREVNRLRSLLAGYYPAALAAFPDLASRRAHGGSAPITRESGRNAWWWPAISATRGFMTRSADGPSPRSAPHPAPAPRLLPGF